MRIVKWLIPAMVSVLFFQAAAAKQLGTIGQTYPISEKDAHQEMVDKAKTINWEKVMREGKEKAIRNYKPDDLMVLPKAGEDRNFLVDMTYTLEMDIPDGKGGILYPKGYQFNPLQYVQYPGIVVIIDADDPRQVEWFKSSDYSKDYRTKLLISKGKYHDLMMELDRAVYYLQPKIIERFKLKAVPSVVVQNGLYMEVMEVNVPDN